MANRIAKWNSVAVLLAAGALWLGGWWVNPAALAQSNPSSAKPQTLTGILSDTMCGTKSMGADSKKCLADCIKDMGMKYALVVGDKVYTLEGKEAEIGKLAGGKIKVTGTVQGTTVKVTSVAAGS